jgi:hypothetical protein
MKHFTWQRGIRAGAAVLVAGCLFAACGGNRRGLSTTALTSNGGGAAPAPPPPGGGGGGGGGGGTTTTSQGIASALRVNVSQQVSAPAVALTDGMTHPYHVYSIAGKKTTITFDTSPTGQQLEISLDYRTLAGTTALLGSTTVTTPHTIERTETSDGVFSLNIFDPSQATTLTSLTAVPESAAFSPTTFKAVFHFAGDTFAGFGRFNDLVSAADKTNFANDMTTRLNNIYAQAGVAMTLTETKNITNAALTAQSATLVANGTSVLTSTNFSTYGNLGVDAADAVSGKALDVFVVNRTDTTLPNVLGVCSCSYAVSPHLGGVFVGKGTRNHVTIVLLDNAGAAISTQAVLGETFAHEVGHFLSLSHPVERDFRYDDFGDTPEIPKTVDVDASGTLNGAEIAETLAGGNNLMFFTTVPNTTQTTLTTEQGTAVKVFLAIRDH